MNVQQTPAVKETEVTEKAKRRSFTAEYRSKILDEASRCTKTGEIGALLRREGLFSSHLSIWRKAQRERGERRGLDARKRGPPAKPQDERDLRIASLERENARLRVDLVRSTTVIEIQKKVSELFGIQPTTHREEN